MCCYCSDQTRPVQQLKFNRISLKRSKILEQSIAKKNLSKFRHMCNRVGYVQRVGGGEYNAMRKPTAQNVVGYN